MAAPKKRRSTLPDPVAGKIPGTPAAHYTPANVAKVLEVLRDGWTITKAARSINARRETIWAWRQQHEDFDEAVREAMLEGDDSVEDIANDRIIHGVDEPVYQGGVLVGSKTKYSDQLLVQQLEARKPDKYRRNLNVSGSLPGGGTVNNILIVANAQDSISAVRAYKQLMKGDGSKD